NRESTRPGPITNLCATSELRPDALDDRNSVVACTAVAAEPRFLGVGADHGKRRDALLQWKRSAIVLQQRDRRARRLERERAMRRRSSVTRRRFRVHIRMLEKLQLEFQ